MSERKITKLNLNNADKSKLRTYFSEQRGRNFRSITEITPLINTINTDSELTYELLRVRYNDNIDLQRKLKQKTKKQLIKQLAELQQLGELNPPPVARDRQKPKMVIEKLKGYVNNWLKDKKGFYFEIKLRSRNADITRTFVFNHKNHFNNWIDKITTTREDSAGNILPESEYDLFKDIIIENIKMVGGGCNTNKAKTIGLTSSFYNYKLFNPYSKDNNCFFACLNHIRSLGDDRYIYKKLRQQFNLEMGAEISIDDAYKISQSLGYDIQIINYDINEELDDTIQYIVYQDSHYYVLESFESVVLKDKKTKRGLLTFDFETRKTEEYDVIKATGEKLYILKDSLCCVYYRRYKKTECETVRFVSGEKSSARQLIDWFNEESKKGRTYNVLAHNGGRFDYYFFINSLTSKELLECDMHFRGTTIISINYRGHSFKDSACFLTDSLKNLCKSFKINDGKITKFNLHGEEITSEQLCFYRNELTFDAFMDLQNTDKEFWELYDKYCLYDCIALFQIWEKFTVCVNTLIEKINPYLLSNCRLTSSTTIGSHSKKIIVEINKYNGKINKYKRQLEQFTGIDYVKDGDKWKKQIDHEKYEFLCNFKRGGISHCNKAGVHYTGTTGIDIASQYSASLMYSKIPVGKSEWTDKYDELMHGFYLIENMVFESYKLKPVALSNKGQSLNWATNEMNELYVDSYMLKYLIINYGLKSFTVKKGLVSKTELEGSKIFGAYIGTFYDEKKLQDRYKESKVDTEKALYNEALRSTIKLYLNSLTGKLVENPAIHFSVKFDDNGTSSLNGVGVSKNHNDDKINDWIVAGIMVYSYSKRLLFEYIKCLPNNSDDVIHIETDGIYFSTQLLDEFSKNLKNYKGDYPCKFGEDLGNIKLEKSTGVSQVSYFLGKKFYCITIDDKYKTMTRKEIKQIEGDKERNIYRIKGIQQKTINKDGSDKWLVDVSLYETVFAGNNVKKTFQTLKKSLFCEHTRITAYEMTREITSDKKNYNLYVPQYKFMEELKNGF
jgi:hypothetical protein